MRERTLGPVARVAAIVVTLVIVVSYGLALRYAASTGHLWWSLPLGLAITLALYFVVTDKEERQKGNAEMAENFRRLNPWRKR